MSPPRYVGQRALLDMMDNRKLSPEIDRTSITNWLWALDTNDNLWQAVHCFKPLQWFCYLKGVWYCLNKRQQFIPSNLQNLGLYQYHVLPCFTLQKHY